MKKTRLIMLSLLLLISSFYLVILNNREVSDFDFSLKYNVEGKDFVSTFDHSLVQDTVDGMVRIDFEFKKEDLEKIKSKIEELEIMVDDFSGLPSSETTYYPMSEYHLQINLGGEIKNIRWSSRNANIDNALDVLGKIDIDDEESLFDEITLVELESKDHKSYEGAYGRVNKLFDLKTYIIEIIKEYDQYKELPAHKMYL